MDRLNVSSLDRHCAFTASRRRLNGVVRAALLCGAACSLPRAAAGQVDDGLPHEARLTPGSGLYTHAFVTGTIGESVRFNNPYRLQTQLGSSAKSLSRTPLYGNLGAAAAWGAPDGWQHGVSLQWSRALSGLPQHVVTPSYILVQGGWRPWLAYARAGVPIILNPDTGAGGELGLGGAWLFTAGLGLHAEVVGDVFYGAATWEKGITTIPMLSLQLGLIADHEVLP